MTPLIADLPLKIRAMLPVSAPAARDSTSAAAASLMAGNNVVTPRTNTEMRSDRRSVERSFREAVRKAVSKSFDAGKPVYGRDKKTGKRVLLYSDGRQVEVIVSKSA